MTVQHKTIRVQLSGNYRYPGIRITYDNYYAVYYSGISESSVKRIQLLFDIHRQQGGEIYVDIENSAIELTKEKSV